MYRHVQTTTALPFRCDKPKAYQPDLLKFPREAEPHELSQWRSSGKP